MVSDEEKEKREGHPGNPEDRLAGTCPASPALCAGSKGTVQSDITLPGSVGLRPESFNGEKEAQDEDEGHIELLQSYLKKALNGDDDPNIGK